AASCALKTGRGPLPRGSLPCRVSSKTSPSTRSRFTWRGVEAAPCGSWPNRPARPIWPHFSPRKGLLNASLRSFRIAVILHQGGENPNRTPGFFGARTRRAGSRRSASPDANADGLLALGVVGSMLAIGTVYPSVLLVVMLIVVAAFGVAFKASN